MLLLYFEKSPSLGLVTDAFTWFRLVWEAKYYLVRRLMWVELAIHRLIRWYVHLQSCLADYLDRP